MEADNDSDRLSEQYRHQQQVLANWSMDSGIDVLHSAALRAAIVTVYVVVIVFGVLGNGLVVAVAATRIHRPSPASRNSLQSATNVFVACLALSDLALCMFSLPVQLHYQLTNNWYFGSVLCRVVFAAFAVPMHLSTCAIMLIALDRYLLIVRPFGKRLSGRVALWLVAMSLAMSVLLAAPIVHYTTLKVVDPVPEIRMAHCVEDWDSAAVRRAYGVFAFVVLFCLPLVVTATLYGRIYARLRRRRHRALFGHQPTNGPVNPFRLYPSTGSDAATTERGRPSPMTAASNNVVSRTNKTNRILAAIVVNFVVCWLPWHLFGLITELEQRVVRGRYFEVVELSLKAFAMVSACVNPLLYCWLNENLRRDLGYLSIRLNPFYRLTRSLAGGGGEVTDLPGGAAQGDLPRFNIQPPSYHSNAAGTGTGAAAIGIGLAILPEGSQSTGADSDSPRRLTQSTLAVSEHFSISSVGFATSVGHTSENQPQPENAEL